MKFKNLHALKAALLSAAILSVNICLASSQSNREPLKDGWLYLQGDISSIWEAVRPEVNVPIWSEVTLPHCFNATDAVDPELNYYQGVGWYKTLLDIDNPYKNGRVILDFDGAGQKSEVYIYMTKVGSHVGGYDEWSVDITDAVAQFLASDVAKEKRFKGRVPLSIRCDNSRDNQMIPSTLSDFNLYGGIYRNLHLAYVPALSFNNIYAKAEVDPKSKVGVLNIYGSFYNPTSYTSSSKVDIVVTDPAGRKVSSVTVAPKFFGEDNLLHTLTLKKPTLWSTESPNLYSVQVTLHSDDGEYSASERCGFRYFEFEKNGPFLLNGERLLLRGTHRHEDHAGLAAALSYDIMREEMEMMKRMGVNFIRLGHYQQDSYILDLCDELGIIVWEEIPWCRGGVGGGEYQAQSHRMLTNMIRQHRNHPSIVLWGMGNENDWPNDFPEFSQDSVRRLMSSLNDLSHSLDPTRVTTIRRCDFAKDILDVYSFSIWPGWYKGRYTDYYNAMYHASQNVDHFLHVEWGGDSHAGRFSEDPYSMIDQPDYDVERTGQVEGDFKYTNKKSNSKGDWSESYICDLFDWGLKEQENMPWLTGAANWTFKDFSTPLRPENPVPYVNQKGLIERDGTPKESYYVFQSYWATEPMVRVFGHKWYVRWGEKGEAKQVRVYSNCDRVELFLNGKSQGVKVRNSQDFPAAGLRWDCVMEEGENTIKAVAYSGKGSKATTITDEITQEYQSEKWGDVAQIDAQIIERGDGYVWVEAMFKDAGGVRCLDSRDYFAFEYAGDGEMICNMGTASASRIVQAANGRGRIKVEFGDGEGVLAIKSEGLKTAFVTIR